MGDEVTFDFGCGPARPEIPQSAVQRSALIHRHDILDSTRLYPNKHRIEAEGWERCVRGGLISNTWHGLIDSCAYLMQRVLQFGCRLMHALDNKASPSSG
jgi:hypothetical protein